MSLDTYPPPAVTAKQRPFLSAIFRRKMEQAFVPSSPFIYDAQDHRGTYWQEGTYVVDNIAVPYYIAHAQNPRLFVIALSGFKAQHAITQQEAKIYNLKDTSVMWVNLLRPDANNNTYMDFYHKLIDNLLLSDNSPIKDNFAPGLPGIIRAHSTGAQIVFDLATHVNTADQIAKRYKSIALEGTFFDNANASRQDTFAREKTFTVFANMFKHSMAHETTCGSYYLVQELIEAYHAKKQKWPDSSLVYHAMPYISHEAAKHLSVAVETMRYRLGIKDSLFAKAIKRTNSELLPTFKEILEIRTPGRRISDEVTGNAPNRVKPSIEMVLYMGSKDKYACNKQALINAQAVGVEHMTVDSAHTPLRDSKAATRDHLRRIEPYMLPKIEPLLVQEPQTEEAAEAASTYWPPMRLPVWLGQRGAGFLNTLASRFQRALGRGIADAEVRGEPERRTLNAGNAHTLQ